MQVTHMSVEVSTQYKGNPRPEPVWIGRYIISADDGSTVKDTRKILGKAHTKRTRAPDGYLAEPEARKVLENLARAEGAKVQAAQGVTFGETVQAYLSELKRRIRTGDFRASTLKTYRNIISQALLPRWEDEYLRAIGDEDLKVFRTELANRGVAASTLNQYRAVLCGIWKIGGELFGVDTDPTSAWARAKSRRTSSGTLQFYRPDEVLLLAEAADAQHDAALLITAAFTGLRMSELRALRWRSVDFANSLIHVEKGYTNPVEVDGETMGGEDLPKSYKVRSMPLMPQVAEVLRRLHQREYFTGDRDLVFASESGGVLDNSVIYRRFRKAQNAAGLHRIRFHDLRHSFGTMAIRVATIVDVQTWMGHADIATTRKYLHYAPQPDAAKALGSLIGEQIAPVVSLKRVA